MFIFKIPLKLKQFRFCSEGDLGLLHCRKFTEMSVSMYNAVQKCFREVTFRISVCFGVLNADFTVLEQDDKAGSAQ